jgi:hypothetical protein
LQENPIAWAKAGGAATQSVANAMHRTADLCSLLAMMLILFDRINKINGIVKKPINRFATT